MKSDSARGLRRRVPKGMLMVAAAQLPYCREQLFGRDLVVRRQQGRGPLASRYELRKYARWMRRTGCQAKPGHDAANGRRPEARLFIHDGPHSETTVVALHQCSETRSGVTHGQEARPRLDQAQMGDLLEARCRLGVSVPHRSHDRARGCLSVHDHRAASEQAHDAFWGRKDNLVRAARHICCVPAAVIHTSMLRPLASEALAAPVWAPCARDGDAVLR